MNPTSASATGPAPAGAVSTSSPTAASALEVKRLLVPLDFSAHAMKALRYATAFARLFRARLIVLHVTEPIVYPSDFGYAPLPPQALEENFQQDARERLEAVASEQSAAGVACEVALRLGKPYQEIAAAAREMQVDLIVITTHGYAGLTHVLLGSTAERVVRHAPCPVLVVRDQETDFVREPGESSAPAV
jgi:nucleotide-binding universal stress UspA family protein